MYVCMHVYMYIIRGYVGMRLQLFVPCEFPSYFQIGYLCNCFVPIAIIARNYLQTHAHIHIHVDTRLGICE